MDLSRLRNALNDPKRKGDVDLQASFRSSALHLTQFLKTAQLGQEKAYQQGYADALSDVLGVIQAGLDGPTKGISEVIDWIDARQEALAADSSEAEIDDDTPAPSQRQEEPIASASQPSPPTPQHPPTSTFNFSCPLPSTSSIPSSSTASPSVEPTPITRLAKHKMRKHLKSRANSHNAERDASGSGSAADEGQEGESRAGRKRTYEDDPMALFEEHVRPAKRVARR